MITYGGERVKLEQIGITTDWFAVGLALVLALLVKSGLVANIPW
ncbi:hypothetical protein JCM15060_06340 [Halanaerobaculum tunisiense]